jgi:hypothetical protein
MKLTNEDIKDYQALCRQRWGVEVNDTRARLELAELVLCMELTFKEMSVDDMSGVRNRQAELAHGLSDNNSSENDANQK